MLEGGPAVVRECLRRNLADDYWFFVQPVVYGKGPRYWGPMDDQTTLSLIETKPASYTVWVDTQGHPGDLRGKLFAGMAHM